MKLTASGPLRSVFDDDADDVLIGNQGLDWFFVDVDDDEHDEVRNESAGEIID